MTITTTTTITITITITIITITITISGGPVWNASVAKYGSFGGDTPLRSAY
jgi:hypothetical protein